MDDGFTSDNRNVVHTGSSDSYPGTKSTCSSSSYTTRTDVAKDAMSKMVKLATKIEETSSDAIGYGMVSFGVTPYPDKVWRAMLSILSLPAESRMKVDGVSFQEKGGWR